MRVTLPIMFFSAALALTATTHQLRAQDSAKEDAAKVDAAKEDAAKVDAAKEEAAKEDASEEETAEAEPVKRDCHLFGVTWDGGSKRSAAQRAQSGLKETIAQWRARQGRNSGWRSNGVTIEGHAMRPNPYWRSRVTGDLYLRPDVRTATSYTVCWKGVISTAVCTAGAKVCK